jgi:hypothetical protein
VQSLPRPLHHRHYRLTSRIYIAWPLRIALRIILLNNIFRLSLLEENITENCMFLRLLFVYAVLVALLLVSIF